MEKSPGKISLCKSKECNFKCCDFNKMTHILLIPGELETAQAHGQSASHLEILDKNYYGGMRVRCHAKDTSSCNNGYKPLDCISYPFFPVLSDNLTDKQYLELIIVGKGSECPISRHEILYHESFVQNLWKNLIKQKPTLLKWLRSVSSGPTDDFDDEKYQL